MNFIKANIKGKYNIIEASYSCDTGLCRKTFVPTDDVSGEDQAIQDLASEYHTQEVKDSFSANLS